jgi:hypothetical protein
MMESDSTNSGKGAIVQVRQVPRDIATREQLGQVRKYFHQGGNGVFVSSRPRMREQKELKYDGEECCKPCARLRIK